MADSFLKALQGTALNIGQKLPKIDSGGFPNIMKAMPGFASAPKTQASSTGLGAITVKPGGSTRYEKVHPGVDIANAIGTKLPAFAGGAVSGIKTGQRQGSPGYGNYVLITDKDGNKHRYSHLNDVMVRVGDEINPGQTIGTMGNTGQTYSLSGGTGSHLDYRILNAFGKYIDPMIYVNALSGKN